MSALRSDDDEGKIRVQLVSVDPRYAVPDADMAVPGTLRRGGLSSVVNYLLGFSGDDDAAAAASAMDTGGLESSSNNKQVDFDFLVDNRFLRTSISGYVRSHNVSAEELVVIHFVPRLPKPEPSPPPPPLPDWVSCLSCPPSLGGVLISACYDGNIRLHNAIDLNPVHTLGAHAGAIRTLACTSSGGLLASGGLDQQLLVHEVVVGGGGGGVSKAGKTGAFKGATLAPAFNCREGHASSVESCAWSFGDVAVGGGGGSTHTLASGDWDGKLCLWSLDAGKLGGGGGGGDAASAKKRKTGTEAGALTAGVTTVAPKSTTKLHASCVSGLAWSSASPNIMYSGSWDYSVKAFDANREDVILTLNGSRVVSCLAKSSHSEVLATGHPDCHVKLWDVRVNKSVGAVMTADDSLKPDHGAWVTGVTWDDVRPFNLATASQDGTVKAWDVRCSLPLYTLKAHVKPGKPKAGKEEGKALAVCYGENSNSIFSGGNDCQVRKFTVAGGV